MASSSSSCGQSSAPGVVVMVRAQLVQRGIVQAYRESAGLNFEEPPCQLRADRLISWRRVINSAGECYLHTVEVTGSNPVSPTIKPLAGSPSRGFLL